MVEDNNTGMEEVIERLNGIEKSVLSIEKTVSAPTEDPKIPYRPILPRMEHRYMLLPPFLRKPLQKSIAKTGIDALMRMNFKKYVFIGKGLTEGACPAEFGMDTTVYNAFRDSWRKYRNIELEKWKE